jgi:hypothetical protein
MAPKPQRAFVFLAMAVTVLAITVWASRNWAAPIPPTIYAPQHLILY